MSQVDDFQNGEEAVAQLQEEQEAATQLRRQQELDEEPLRPTATRPRRRQQVAVAEIAQLTNMRPDLPEIHELALSIKERGLLQAPQLRATPQADQPYQLFAGRRRLEAIKLLGWETVECDVFEELPDAEAFELMLLENVQRVDLEPLHAARGLRLLLSKREQDSAAELARSLGLSPAWVRRHLKLLDLPESVRERVERGEISVTLADLLGKAERAGRVAPDELETLAEQVARGETSASAAAAQVAPPRPRPAVPADDDASDLPDLDDWGAEAPPVARAPRLSAETELVFESDAAGVAPPRAASEPERPALWAQLDAYLLTRILNELASPAVRDQLGVGADAGAWAQRLGVAERAAQLRDLAALLAGEDAAAPAELRSALDAE